jgi:L-alanine-DL-glutamate epimerase-like enolase superfamily enzyme
MQEIAGNVTAKAALDMAMHDAAAKSCGVPLCAYLGAEGDRLQATWMINLMTPDEAVDVAESYFESGFRSFKVKGGVDVARDIALAVRLRDALGDSSTIYFDHNQGYSLNEAMKFAIATRNVIDFVEEPLPAWGATARRLLRESTAVSLLGDESVFTPKDVEREIELGALSIIGIKTARTGFRSSAQIADLAQRAGLPTLLGSQGDSYLGTVCGASFGVARGTQLPAELAFYMELSGDVILERSPISDGYFHIPLGPGVGLTLDLAALKHYRIDE